MERLKIDIRKCRIWNRRRDIILALMIFYITYKFIFYIWYINIPKTENSILCSFGRGKKKDITVSCLKYNTLYIYSAA